MECWCALGVCIRRCPAAHPGAARTGDSKFLFLYLFFHKFRQLQPQVGKRWCNYRGREWFGQCGIVLVLPLRNSSFTESSLAISSRSPSTPGRRGEGPVAGHQNFTLFDDLEQFDLRDEFQSGSMPSDYEPGYELMNIAGVCFSADDLSTCVVAIELI